MPNQLVIQVLLVAIFLLFAIVVIAPGKGARRLAIRRIALFLALLAGIFAVIFPDVVNDFANILGVGRGTDLILYALVVVFLGNSLATAAQNRQLHREITQVARHIALREAKDTAEPGPVSPENRQ